MSTHDISSRQVKPSRVSNSQEEILLPEQVQSWREQGFVLVDGVFPQELIATLIQETKAHFFAPDGPEAKKVFDFGSEGRMNFPSQIEALNQVSLHPHLLRCISQLLSEDISDLRLTQSDLWAKYGRAERVGKQDNSDQRIHVDYPNHTLTHPPRWDQPEAVELILYLSDVQECGGGTAVVPRQGLDDPAYRWPIVDTPGVADLDYVNDRESAETYMATQRPHLTNWRASLYEREIYAGFQPGTVLFYRHDTWHRGTPLKTGTMRLAHNLTFRKAASEWISTLHTGWSWMMYSPSHYLEKLIAKCSVEQRCVLGFPKPNSPYWTNETLEAVEARYRVFGMDMKPYRFP